MRTFRLQFETLESRELLAADVWPTLAASNAFKESLAASGAFAESFAASGAFAESFAASGAFAETNTVQSNLIGEGEGGTPAPDLVAFAKALSAAEVRFFCAAWSETCTQQKELFEDGGQFLPFEEVSDSSRNRNQLALDEGITVLPTWQFGDASNRVEEAMTLEEIATAAGIEIPLGFSPSLAPIVDGVVAVDAALHVAVDAYDPNADPLTITVESSDPSLLTADVLTGNRTLRFSVEGYGDMTFQLFEQRVPRPTQRIIELTNSGFYDNTLFHRVIDNFVIQGGDPTGTGAGGSSLGDFDDQYAVELQHNATGILSYAKSTDDTNDSQFFVIDAPQPHLNYNHSVFGALVEGEANRDAINSVLTFPGSTPFFPVTLEAATIFTDTENAMLRLKPTGVGTGVVDVTVTVVDPEGNSAQEVFQVVVEEDSSNGAPFLVDHPVQLACVNHPATIRLQAVDAEGDDLDFGVQFMGDVPYEFSVEASTGVVTVTPPEDFQGELQFLALVRQIAPTDTSDPTDRQVITVSFELSSHQNQIDRFDVSGDAAVSSLDALLVINHLNTGEPSRVHDLEPGAPFVDVNGDCFVSPLDALLVINFLNQNGEEGGEGESLSMSAMQQAVPNLPADSSASENLSLDERSEQVDHQSGDATKRMADVAESQFNSRYQRLLLSVESHGETRLGPEESPSVEFTSDTLLHRLAVDWCVAELDSF